MVRPFASVTTRPARLRVSFMALPHCSLFLIRMSRIDVAVQHQLFLRWTALSTPVRSANTILEGALFKSTFRTGSTYCRFGTSIALLRQIICRLIRKRALDNCMQSSVPDRATAPAEPVELPVVSLGQGFRFLTGMRVLDLSTSVAGPYAAMLLGDMGADVVKVERPGAGDDARAWGPPFVDGESAWYLSVNRNKRSVTLDYAPPEGRAVLETLIKASDVVVVNQPTRVQKKLGIDAASCRALRGDLVHVSITGFGLQGQRSDWTCYDLIAEGYSGVMDVTGEPDGPPQKIGAPAADMLAGSDAAFAAVSALFERSRSGKGHSIDVSLVESMTRFLACRIVPYLATQDLPRRSGGKDSVIAIYQVFETADLPLTLGL